MLKEFGKPQQQLELLFKYFGKLITNREEVDDFCLLLSI